MVMKLIAGVFGFIIGALVGYLIGILLDGLTWSVINFGNGQLMPQLLGSNLIVGSYYLTNMPYNVILLLCIVLCALAGAGAAASQVD